MPPKKNKTNKNKISKLKFTLGGPEDQGKKVSGLLSQPSPVLSPDDSSNETIPVGRMAGGTVTNGWKLGQERKYIPNGRTGLKRCREEEVPNIEKNNDNQNSLNVEQTNTKLQKSPVKDLNTYI